jgi:sigma-B regulation protein RsbU (phosphoserine phosphatase)
MIKKMERELHQLRRLARQLNRHFDEIDEELRLAGRLQRDLLPQTLPNRPPLRFAQLYRPAGWVSGDIFDTFAIGDRHIGVFIADAMGHGTAAGLITMLLRRALVPIERRGDGERVRSAADVMRQLHDGLAQQNLPHSQFVTAAYGLVDVQSLEFSWARGGHPYPLHIDTNGKIRELRSDGALLGVAGLEPEFEERRQRLAPGDKILLYTDGLEELFIDGRDPTDGSPRYSTNLQGWAPLGAEAFTAAIGDYLDHQEGSLNPQDDVTVVVLEVAR